MINNIIIFEILNNGFNIIYYKLKKIKKNICFNSIIYIFYFLSYFYLLFKYG